MEVAPGASRPENERGGMLGTGGRSGGYRRIVWALLLVALLLRAAALLWGLPLVNPYASPHHPDEGKIVEAAADFPGHVLQNTDFRYPTFLHYLTGLLASLVYGFPPGQAGDFFMIYLLARALSLLAGVGSVALTYAYGRRYLGARHGLLAAGLLAFSLYHAQSSSWATTDVMSSTLLLAALFLGRRAISEKGSAPAYLLAGATFGLLIGTRYTGIVLLPALAWIYLTENRSRRQGLRSWFGATATDWGIYAFALASALMFFLSTPGAILHYDMLPEAFRYETARLGRSPFTQLAPTIWLGAFSKMVTSFGAPLAAASLTGLVVPLRRRSAADWAPALTLAGVLVGFGDALLPRYLILVAPSVALLASGALLSFHRERPRWRRLAALVLIGGVTLYSFLYSAAGAVSRLGETRTEATRYLAESIPAGATVGVAYTATQYAWESHAYRYPSLDRDRTQYVDFLQRPQVVVVSSYDLEPIRRALASEELLPGYEWPEAIDDVWYRGAEPTPEIFRFYDELIHHQGPYCLIERFSPRVLVPIEFPPPEIRIYAREDWRGAPPCR